MAEPALPTYLDLLLPTLRALDDLGGSGWHSDIDEAAIKRAKLSPEQVAVSYSHHATQSGSKVRHRLAWARSLLKRIGAAESVSRGTWAITELGRSYLALPLQDADAALRAAERAAREGVEPDPAFYADARQRAEDGEPLRLTVRDLIRHWGGQRRGAAINERVRSGLAAHDLTTDPPFAATGIDQEVAVLLHGDEPSAAAEPESLPAIPPVTITVGNLPSATGGVVGVNLDDALITAQSLMMANDFSQLAARSGPHTLRGAISWESIAQARLKNPQAELKDCIVRPVTVDLDTPLLDVVPQITQAGFVFVQSKGALVGIVTTADLSDEFAARTKPFLLVSEIELWLRAAIDARFSPEELAEYLDPDDADREVEAAHSLTLGEHQQVLSTPDAWERLGWPADRKVFIGQLDEVRKIRNGIVHFSPDPIADADVNRLNVFLKWVRHLVGTEG